MIEKHYSINRAAKIAGITDKTLKRWLQEDLGIVFPRVRHGAKLLVRQADVMLILAKRRDVRNVPPRNRRKPHAAD